MSDDTLNQSRGRDVASLFRARLPNGDDALSCTRAAVLNGCRSVLRRRALDNPARLGCGDPLVVLGEGWAGRCGWTLRLRNRRLRALITEKILNRPEGPSGRHR